MLEWDQLVPALREPHRAGCENSAAAAEEWLGALTRILGRGLERIHGAGLEGEVLARPAACLALHQAINSAGEPEPRVLPATRPFATLKEWAAVGPEDPVRALLARQLESGDPFAWARRHLREAAFPRAAAPAPAEARVGARRRGRASLPVGVSFGFPGADRLRLTIRLRGRVRWVRAREVLPASWQSEQRARLLEAVASAAATADLPHPLPSLLAYLVLTLPTYALENLPAEKARAEAEAAGVCGLVSGTEFQRKPGIAVLWAVLKAQGKPIHLVQHGGGYGQADPNWWERAERFVADRFHTWGTGSLPGDTPLPSPKLSREAARARRSRPAAAARGPSARPPRALLLFPYFYHELEAALASPPYDQQAAAAQRSLEMLEPLHARGWNLTVRLHPKNRADDPRVPPLPPGTLLERGQRDVLAVEGAHYDAVFFASPCATGLAECRAGGLPFRIVADPADFAIRAEAAPFFEEARRVGVWWTAAEQAEAWGAAGCPPPGPEAASWFARFGERFALGGPDGGRDTFREWAGLLREIAGEATQP